MLLRKLSVYFLLRRWEILEKSRECFLTKKHSPDAVRGGTGRWPERPVCCQCLARLGLSTGRRVFPVSAFGVACLQLRFSNKAPDAPE